MEFDPLAVAIPEEKEVVEVKRDLSECSATWEHEDLAQVKIKEYTGHQDQVKSCVLLDNDEKILSSSFDKTAILWDRETGSCIQKFQGGHSMYLTEACASPCVDRVVTTGWDKQVNLWNTETGRILWTGTHEGIVTSCGFSPCGKYVVSGSDLDYTIKMWDAQSGELIHEIKDAHTSTITKTMFSPPGDRIVSTSMDRTCLFFDLRSLSHTIKLKDHINVISGASFTNDERKFATVSWDRNINVYDISTGMYRSEGPQVIEKAHEGCISACSFSTDGLLMATCGYDNAVCVFDVENSVQTLRLLGHSDWVEDICFSKDQNWVLTCSKDKTMRMWNVENADNIPSVQETKKAIGLQIYSQTPPVSRSGKKWKCSKCGKPFSTQDGDFMSEGLLCVFCRMDERYKNFTPLSVQAREEEGLGSPPPTAQSTEVETDGLE